MSGLEVHVSAHSLHFTLASVEKHRQKWKYALEYDWMDDVTFHKCQCFVIDFVIRRKEKQEPNGKTKTLDSRSINCTSLIQPFDSRCIPRSISRKSLHVRNGKWQYNSSNGHLQCCGATHLFEILLCRFFCHLRINFQHFVNSIDIHYANRCVMRREVWTK